MKSLLSLTLAAWSMLTLSSCIDLAALDGPGYGGGGYSGGGYSGGGYRPAPAYSEPYYGGGGYRPAPHYDYAHDSHSHNNSRDNDYFGGPSEWYKSGVGIGKRDRKEHRPCNYRSHSSQYDRKTESQFARGYMDGYNH